MSCLLDEANETLRTMSLSSLKPTNASGKLEMQSLGIVMRQRELSLALSEADYPADDSIIGAYRIVNPGDKNKNALYYLEPGTRDIYFLSVTQAVFIKHELKRALPSRITSV